MIKTYLQTHTVYAQIIFIILTYENVNESSYVEDHIVFGLNQEFKNDDVFKFPKNRHQESEFLDCLKISIHVCFYQHNPDLSVELF